VPCKFISKKKRPRVSLTRVRETLGYENYESSLFVLMLVTSTATAAVRTATAAISPSRTAARAAAGAPAISRSDNRLPHTERRSATASRIASARCGIGCLILPRPSIRRSETAAISWITRCWTAHVRLRIGRLIWPRRGIRRSETATISWITRCWAERVRLRIGRLVRPSRCIRCPVAAAITGITRRSTIIRRCVWRGAICS
jgi:hypothetical protein